MQPCPSPLCSHANAPASNFCAGCGVVLTDSQSASSDTRAFIESSSHAARIAARRHTFAVAQRARDRYESIVDVAAPTKASRSSEELDLHGHPLRPGQLGAVPRRRLTISRSLSASANLPMYFPVTDPIFVHTSTRDMAPGERIHSAIEEFLAGKYQLASSSTQVEVLIVATMYAEDEQCMRRTMHGIAANVRNLTDKDKGPGLATAQIAVLIVADGREKMPQETAKYLQHLHIYEPEVAEDAMEAWEAIPVEFGDGRPTMHMFENTVLVPVESDSPISVPVNVTLAVKEANAGKLDSHHWALQAFAGQLEPTTARRRGDGAGPRLRAAPVRGARQQRPNRRLLRRNHPAGDRLRNPPLAGAGSTALRVHATTMNTALKASISSLRGVDLSIQVTTAMLWPMEHKMRRTQTNLPKQPQRRQR